MAGCSVRADGYGGGACLDRLHRKFRHVDLDVVVLVGLSAVLVHRQARQVGDHDPVGRVEASDDGGIPPAEARVVVSGGRGTDGDLSAVEALAERVP